MSDQPPDRGDRRRWSLLVIRDMMFGNRHHFGELLAGSEEGSPPTSSPTV